MENRSQPKLKRDSLIRVLVSGKPPYKVINKGTNEQVGTTLDSGEGIYMHDVSFKTVDGQPILEGRYKGRLEELRLNLSSGNGVMFDESRQVFTDGEKVISFARMVQVYSGVIKVVID